MKRITRRLRIWHLRWKEFILECEIATKEDLILDHQRRLRAFQERLRTVRVNIAILETPQTLLAQALRGKR